MRNARLLMAGSLPSRDRIEIERAVAVAETFQIGQPQRMENAEHHVGERRRVRGLELHAAP